MLQEVYESLLEGLKRNEIKYRVFSGDLLNFSDSDVDFILLDKASLFKVKSIVLSLNCHKIVRINTDNQYYVTVMHGDEIHAFDFTVGLIINHQIIASPELFFEQADYLGVYKVLKDKYKSDPKYLKTTISKKNIFHKFKVKVQKFYNLVLRLLDRNCNGAVIATLGADGSGKSTAIKIIKDSLSIERKLFPLKEIYFNPQIIKIKPNKKFKPDTLYKPHENKKYSSLVSCLKVCYFFLNLILYSPVFYARKLTGSLIIFDRHFYDMLVDCKRYGINDRGQKLAYILSKYIPKPDLVIVITSDISLLSERKPGEVSNEILIELNNKYKKINIDGVNIRHLVNNKSLDEFKREINSSTLGAIYYGL